MKVADLTWSHVLSRTVEEGECLIWTGYSGQGGFPQWRIDGRIYPARRLIYALAKRAIPAGYQVSCTCKTPGCVQPLHLVARSRADAMKGHRHSTATKLMIGHSKQQRSVLLSTDSVRAIRASSESNKAVDALYGLRSGYAWRIRSGKRWVEKGNPFTGLGARS